MYNLENTQFLKKKVNDFDNGWKQSVITCYLIDSDGKKEKTTVKYISSTTPYNFAEANVYVLDLDGAR